MLKNQNYFEEFFISHLKIDEKCEMDVILGCSPQGDEACSFYGPVN